MPEMLLPVKPKNLSRPLLPVGEMNAILPSSTRLEAEGDGCEAAAALGRLAPDALAPGAAGSGWAPQILEIVIPLPKSSRSVSFRIGLSTLTDAVNMLAVEDDTRNWMPSAEGHSGSGGGTAGGGAGGEWSSQTPESSAWHPSKEKTQGTPAQVRASRQQASRDSRALCVSVQHKCDSNPASARHTCSLVV